MSTGWKIAKRNFTDDDGSLPGIEFRHLSPERVRALVDCLCRYGTITTETAKLSDDSCPTDVPFSKVEDRAELVITGAAGSFHCCFGNITNGGVAIPTLGLFVFRDCIEIDYRMGPEWNPSNVDAFFRLLSHLKSLAPEAIVGSAEGEGLPYPEDFKHALTRYTEVK